MCSVNFRINFFSSCSFWARCITDAHPGPQARFKETLELFFEAVNIQAASRDKGELPDLESYIDVRRDTSGAFASRPYQLFVDLAN